MLSLLLFRPSPSTFPTLTTIYVGTGVKDDGGGDNIGTATSFHCSNVSGVTVNLRILVLNPDGQTLISKTCNGLLHGQSLTASTHFTTLFNEDTLATFGVSQGVVNIDPPNPVSSATR